MPKTRAVTHADLAPNPGSTHLGSKAAAFLMILTIVCCLFCFVLCIIAEANRSQMAWVMIKSHSKENINDNLQCIYKGSGKTPLLCGAIAFVGLASAMVLEHIYLLVIVSKTPPPIAWDPDSAFTKNITWQAGFFFVTTCTTTVPNYRICFAVGEMLLLFGVAVESGHLKDWYRPRPNCLIVKEGLFSVAGVFALLAGFFAFGLYLIALRALRMSKVHENTRPEILEASAAFYVFPPRSLRHGNSATARENQNEQTITPTTIGT
ncbi:unnamed protein product [Dovyalis caffra]|uniref:Uncharacterized protein n=1 Tax=Dovyalis caffra TaxID=77055 RepID=A0AAV1R044_9ROSI|nr:unnamed protein product [Dovyalis caffra]